MSPTKKNGRVSIFSAWLELTKGGWILHRMGKKYSSEHYQFGKII